jgi:hypothetical protein
VEVCDTETGARTALDLRGQAAALAREESSRRAELLKTFRACGLEPIISSTDKPSLEPLIAFFRHRARRKSRGRRCSRSF